MSKGSSFYPSLRVVPANWSTREMDPRTKRYRDVPNPLKFLASFQRSESGPQYTAKVATEAEGSEWCQKMLRENWTTPARKVTDYGEKIPTGTERYAHDGTVYRPEPFTQGPGEPATGTVRGWSKDTWEKVHKLQREYIRETAQAWKDAAVVANSFFARRAQLERDVVANRVPHPCCPEYLTSSRDYVNAHREKACAELAKLPKTPTWPPNLVAVIEAAAARRDAAVAKVVAV